MEVSSLVQQLAQFGLGKPANDGGGLTALVLAAREDCLECAQAILHAGADINQVTFYGWTPLLTATQNRHYKLAAYLLDHGANPNLSNKGGWSPLYLATDNRNIESGDYPVRTPDMDHLEFIQLLLNKGANVNARVCGPPAKAPGGPNAQGGPNTSRVARATARRPEPISPCSGCSKKVRRRFCGLRSPETCR